MTQPTQTPRGLKYRGDVENLSVYDFWLRGRVVLEVAVDNTQESSDQTAYPILIGKPGTVDVSANALIKTNGRATRSMFYVPGDGVDAAPESLHEHVNSDTVRSYVRPRLAVLLAKAFVPEAVQPTE